jgi:hypothetical protein
MQPFCAVSDQLPSRVGVSLSKARRILSRTRQVPNWGPDWWHDMRPAAQRLAPLPRYLRYEREDGRREWRLVTDRSLVRAGERFTVVESARLQHTAQRNGDIQTSGQSFNTLDTTIITINVTWTLHNT